MGVPGVGSGTYPLLFCIILTTLTTTVPIVSIPCYNEFSESIGVLLVVIKIISSAWD